MSRPWVWTPARLQAAAEIATDERSDDLIAADANIHRSTLARWKRRPEFAARVHELREQFFDQLSAAVRAEWDRRWHESMQRSRERRRRPGA